MYWDTSYLVRLYVNDAGWQKVRQLARTGEITCSMHGRTEAIAAFHRKLREQLLTPAEFAHLLPAFDHECDEGAFRWTAISEAVLDRAHAGFLTLPSSMALRAADALHLASAVAYGFKQIYSNDVRLLAAAPHFGLAGVNII